MSPEVGEPDSLFLLRPSPPDSGVHGEAVTKRRDGTGNVNEGTSHAHETLEMVESGDENVA